MPLSVHTFIYYESELTLVATVNFYLSNACNVTFFIISIHI